MCHEFPEYELAIPGGVQHDPRGYDPCEWTLKSYTGAPKDMHATTPVTPYDIAWDRSWVVCECDQPEGCERCLHTGVEVQFDRVTGDPVHCYACSPQEVDECLACLGTGLAFRSTGWSENRATMGEVPQYEAAVDRIMALYEPAPSNEPEFVLEVRVLESLHTVQCQRCTDGTERSSTDGGRTWHTRPCPACNGTEVRPAVVGRWLCNVNTETGEYWPKWLPVERTPNGLKRKRHYNRNWRESDGQIYPVKATRAA